MTQARKCDVCRSRKIKCDEKRPICGPCGTRGRPCSFKLADTIAIVKRLPNPGSEWPSTQGVSDSKEGLALRSTRRPATGNGVFHTFSNASKLKRGNKVLTWYNTLAAGSWQEDLDTKLEDGAKSYKTPRPIDLFCMQEQASVPEPQVCGFDLSAAHRQQLKMLLLNTEFPPGTFLRHHLLATYIDWFEPRGKAMQLALDCVLMLHFSRVARNVPSELEKRKLYGSAMEQLRLEIEAPDAAQNDAVLGAIEALTLVEQFNDSKASSKGCNWFTHFRGLERCFEVRGPSTLDSTYGRNLLLNAAPIMIINAVELRTPHFLSQPEWQAALGTCNDNHMVRLCVLAAKIPTILAMVDRLDQVPSASQVVESAASAMSVATRLNHALLSWRTVLYATSSSFNDNQFCIAPLETAFPTFVQQFRHFSQLFPFAYPLTFNRGLDAIHHIWYWICRILVGRALLETATILLNHATSSYIGPPRPLVEKIQSLVEVCDTLAQSICRAVPYSFTETHVPYTASAACYALMYAQRWYEKDGRDMEKATWCQEVRMAIEFPGGQGETPPGYMKHFRRHFSGWTLLISPQDTQDTS